MAVASSTAFTTALLSDYNPNQREVRLLSRLWLFVQSPPQEEHPTAPSTRAVVVAFQEMPQSGPLHLSQGDTGTGTDQDGHWRLVPGKSLCLGAV